MLKIPLLKIFHFSFINSDNYQKFLITLLVLNHKQAFNIS